MVYRKQPLGKNSNVNVFLNPLTDFGFKKVFFDKKILTAFLNDMLGLSIVEIRDFPAEQLGDTKTNRKAVFDLYCITENDEHIIVEMQKEGQSNFADRALFYAAFPLRNQARRGKAWTYGLTPVYMVSILDFILFNDIESRDEVMEKVYLVRERTKTRFSDKLNFLFIELPKFNKSLEELETNIDRWLYCLKHLFDLKARPPELKGEIFDRLFEIARVDNLTTEEMDIYKRGILAYYAARRRYAAADERGRAEYAREKALEKERAEGRAEGRTEGLAEGKWENTVQVIMNSHQLGLPMESIAIVTGLSLEEVKSIISSQLS